MNERSIMTGPEPDPRSGWLDAYMPDSHVGLPQPQAQMISFATIRGVLFRQRWVIAGVIAAALVAGLVMTLLATPMYMAQAKVKVEPFGTFVLEGQDVQRGIASNQVYDYLSTQVEVIKSRSLAEVVVTELKLDERYDLLGSDVDKRRAPGTSDEKWAEAKRQMAISILAGSVEATVPSQNWVIEIGFRSENPVLAAQLANGYADAFVASGTRTSIEDNLYAVKYLQEQIVDVRSKLSDAEQMANAFARNNGIIAQAAAGGEEGGGVATLNSANLTAINQRVSEARAARIAAEQRWRSIQNLPAGQVPEVQNSGALQQLVADRSAKMTQLVDLRQRYNDEFPQIATLLAQIAAIDRQIETRSADIKATLRSEYTIALNQERALTEELASLSETSMIEKDRQVQLSALEREAQALRDQLKALLDRYNQVSSAANVNRGTLSKLDAAMIPSGPYEPNLVKYLALALVFGTALAAILAVLRETLDDRIRSLDDIEEKIGLPLIGHTPHVEERDIESEGGNSFSALMEAYSSIRATIDFSLPRNRNLLHITSSEASEGKSTSASILAELFASLGRKTLLIDADLRRPSIARLLNVERPKVGVVEVLLGHAELESAVVKGMHDNLEILLVGSIPPNPTEIIASPEFRAFLERCKKEYSLVIIDSSPVLGLADAAIISGLADATIFVLEANRVPFGQARAAVRRLARSGGNVMGVVLTKYKALQAGQSYDYQYAYYQYGTEQPKK